MLKFQPKIFENAEIGDYCEVDSVLYFFGNANCNEEVLKSAFPNLSFCFLKQVHNNTIVFRKSATVDVLPIADGQVTLEKNLGLCLKTADCLPVLGTVGHSIFAAHAGWKGIYLRILHKALLQLDPKHVSNPEVCVGPHIKIENYEVQNQLVEQFQHTWMTDYKRNIMKWVLPSPKKPESHSLLNLEGVLSEQVGKWQFDTWWVSPVDTFSSDKHFSYRRNAPEGRNLSFVARRG